MKAFAVYETDMKEGVEESKRISKFFRTFEMKITLYYAESLLQVNYNIQACRTVME